MSDDAGMALLAHIDAIHLDDALARVETGDGCHRAWRETETRKETKERRQGQVEECNQRSQATDEALTAMPRELLDATSTDLQWFDESVLQVFLYRHMQSFFGESHKSCDYK